MSIDDVRSAPSDAVDRGFYGVGELAAMLGVTRQAVQARIKTGSIRATKVNGAWQIPAVVARALVGAEHTRAVVSGVVTELPRREQSGHPGDLVELVISLEGRLDRAEADRAAQAERFERALADLREQLRTRESDIGVLRDDRRRLRRALAALVSEDEPTPGG